MGEALRGIDGKKVLRAAAEGGLMAGVGFVAGTMVAGVGLSGALGWAAGEAIEFAFSVRWDMRVNGMSFEEAAISNFVSVGLSGALEAFGPSLFRQAGDLLDDAWLVAKNSPPAKALSNALQPRGRQVRDGISNGTYSTTRAANDLDVPNNRRARVADDSGDGSVCRVPLRNDNSFSEDTTVATEDGDVAISEIEVGDEVLAYNEETGETGEYVVTDTISHVDPEIVLLTIDGEVIETTPEHPFYTVSGEWVDAADLLPGDLIRTLDGSYGEVASMRIVEREQAMYNLTVDEAHTFFVGDGQWLVHNCSAPAPGEIIPGRFVGDPREVFNSPKPKSGIYEYIDQTGNWYVGKAQDLYKRMNTHLDPTDPHVLASVDEFVFTPIPYSSGESLEIAETIRVLQLRNMGYTVNNDGLKAKSLWPRMRQQIRKMGLENEWPKWLLYW